jgi:hypothetical protein
MPVSTCRMAGGLRSISLRIAGGCLSLARRRVSVSPCIPHPSSLRDGPSSPAARRAPGFVWAGSFNTGIQPMGRELGGGAGQRAVEHRNLRLGTERAAPRALVERCDRTAGIRRCQRPRRWRAPSPPAFALTTAARPPAPPFAPGAANWRRRRRDRSRGWRRRGRRSEDPGCFYGDTGASGKA